MAARPAAATALGPVLGVRVDTPHGPVDRFLGIPYARPPVGPRRFGAPVAAEPWSSPFEATAFGPAPVQSAGPFGGIVPGGAVGPVDESCLTLNVWAPSGPAEEPRPVVVWLYGGAFCTGSSGSPTYDGARLAAEQGVVVVSFNYRLGTLGFLDLRSAGGEDVGAVTNPGLRDQLLALAFVAGSAAGLGGDPKRIALLGESAGAGSVVHLLASPLLAGVRRAIACSPGVDFTQTADVAAEVTARVLHRAGVADATGLLRLPVDELLAAQDRAAGDVLLSVGTMPFHPVLDGDALTATPSVALAAGAAADVDLVIGSTTDELRLFPDPRADGLDDAGLSAWADQLLAARTAGTAPAGAGAALVARYREHLGAEVGGGSLWAALSTDGTMRLPADRLAEAHAAADGRTYAYEMAWSRTEPGAFHAIDLPFLFDAFHVDGWGDFIAADDAAHALGRSMRTAYATFASTGDPSTPDLEWPAYADGRTMRFADPPGAVADPLAEARSWWDGLWSPECRPPIVPL